MPSHKEILPNSKLIPATQPRKPYCKPILKELSDLQIIELNKSIREQLHREREAL